MVVEFKGKKKEEVVGAEVSSVLFKQELLLFCCGGVVKLSDIKFHSNRENLVRQLES